MWPTHEQIFSRARQLNAELDGTGIAPAAHCAVLGAADLLALDRHPDPHHAEELGGYLLSLVELWVEASTFPA